MKPIGFNTEMVKAVLDGRKTQTRRPVKGSPGRVVWNTVVLNGSRGWADEHGRLISEPYSIGDILWVRETFAYESAEFDTISLKQIRPAVTLYRADFQPEGDEPKWYPSIHMPREAARLFLRVTDVRVERVQDISEADAMREGVSPWREIRFFPELEKSLAMETYTAGFAKLWESIYGPKGMGWEQNPWVWVIEFEKIEKP